MIDPSNIKTIAVLTKCNIAHHLTLRLRVILMQPFLETQGYALEVIQLEKVKSRRLSQLEKVGQYDLVWLHRVILTGRELEHVKKISQKIVFDFDDPVCFSSSSFLNFSLKKSIRFRQTVKVSAAILAASPGLVALACKLNNKTYYAPLCAEPENYCLKTNDRKEGENLKLLWLGGRSTFKYLESIAPQLEYIGQHCKNVELIVVGHNQISLQNLPVTNIAWSQEQEQIQLESCHVGLVPSVDDRWTRAKATLKPLQYMASGLPLIASPVGILHQFVDNGNNGFCAKSNNEYLEAVEFFLSNEIDRRNMGANGIAYVKENHSAEKLANNIKNVFDDVLAI
jgi:glycosyltransferase involved in cell wall biosynthesis